MQNYGATGKATLYLIYTHIQEAAGFALKNGDSCRRVAIPSCLPVHLVLKRCFTYV
jgi:hypothetical protein